jgi:hypothetical protein
VLLVFYEIYMQGKRVLNNSRMNANDVSKREQLEDFTNKGLCHNCIVVQIRGLRRGWREISIFWFLSVSRPRKRSDYYQRFELDRNN